MPLLGHVALWLALLAAVWAVMTGVAAGRSQRPDLAASAHCASAAIAVVLIVAVAALAVALLRQDYHVAYVASHSDRALPAVYRWGALFAGPEGRLLCWTAAVSVWGAAASGRDRPLVGAALGAIVAAGVAVLLVVQNPFAQLPYTPVDGGGLPPELQDPAMLLYPPLLYAGFAATMVPFATALAAVPAGTRDVTGPVWPLAAWTLLTAAIASGLWWSYRRAGADAGWLLDPVRNQSLPAWLTLAALLHARRAPESQGRWAPLALGLALAAGVMAVWGTFVPGTVAAERGAVLLALAALVVVIVAIRDVPPARGSARWAQAGVTIAVIVLAAQPFGARAGARLAPGESVTLSGWGGRPIAIRYLATSRYPVANRIVTRALLEVRRGDRVVGRLAPEQRQHVDIFGNDSFAPVQRAAVLHRVGEDVYATLESVAGANDTVQLRIAVNPLVLWLWLACGLAVVAGIAGLLAAPRRLPAPP